MSAEPSNKTPDPMDVALGAAVRIRRRTIGMSQEALAEQCGVSFQQIQKYETGMNRVSASRLWDIADALGVAVAFFFEGFSEEAEIVEAAPDLMSDKEALALVRSYYAIPEAQRRRLFELAKVLSEAA